LEAERFRPPTFEALAAGFEGRATASAAELSACRRTELAVRNSVFGVADQFENGSG
jgi:hypothetical protein